MLLLNLYELQNEDQMTMWVGVNELLLDWCSGVGSEVHTHTQMGIKRDLV